MRTPAYSVVATQESSTQDASSQPRVAVLIPVYQGHAKLAASLSSLAAQGVPCVAVVVDDGSTPAISVTAGEAPVPVVLLRLAANSGIEGAMNAGLDWIARAGIPYVARLDNGDRCLPGRLGRQADLLDDAPDVVLVGCGVRWEDAEGATRFTHRPERRDREIRDAFHGGCPLIHPTVCMRTTAVVALDGYDTAYPAAEDYDLFARLGTVGRYAGLQEVLVVTEFDPHGISLSRRARQLRSRWRIQCRLADWGRSATYVGLLKTAALRVTPSAVTVALKGALALLRARRARPVEAV